MLAEATYRTTPSLNGIARGRCNVFPRRFLQAMALKWEETRITLLSDRAEFAESYFKSSNSANLP
jgi:hypothetical protein